MLSYTIINDAILYPVADLPDYEKRYNLEDKHSKLLRMLCRFDSYCRKHNLFYSLADGTLIGAVRHGDFIPWDDDADIMMTRDEYNKLRETVKKDDEVKLFRIGCLDRVSFEENLQDHLYMDLFIIDKVPKRESQFKQLRYKCAFLRSYFLNIYTLGNSSHHEGYRKIVEPVLYRMARLYVGKKDVFDIYDNLFNKTYTYERYTKFTSTMRSMSKQYNKSTFENGYGDVLFRGIKLMAIVEANSFLKALYGDYQKLPNEEKRVVAHDIDMMQAPEDCIRWYSR